jgi:hypothetical protein
MKPLNLDNRPCSPISSNCVIWQGPDIPCIKLCTGDTVSDVIFKLATELCTIMDQLNVSNYDLTCLGITACPPEDFQALIQLLITKICELSGVTPTEGKASGCPDCVVSVAPCFIENGQTTMQLVDYVQMIANRICSILTEIQSINDQIAVINSTLVDLQFQIDNLPVYTLPSFEVDCILAGSNSLDVIVETLMNDNALGYCALIGSTGTPADINAAVLSQCITDIDQPLAALPVISTFSAYYSGSWVNAAALGADPTVANAINNIWIAICDMYNYLQNFNINVEDTNSIDLTYTGGVLSANIVDTGWVDLLGFNWYTGTSITRYKPQCRRIGNVVHFKGMLMIPLSSDRTGGGTAVPWEYGSIDSYISNTSVVPFQGSGGVTVDAGGSIAFNQNASVIPNSVVSNTPTNYNFDFIVQSNYVVASRNILLDSGDSALLTSVMKIWITADKRLVLQILRDNEYSAGGQVGNIIGTSVLNTLVSRVNEGDRLPQFARVGSTIAGNTTAGQQPLTATYYAGAPAPENYPFACDAGDPLQLGGFGWISIDGMMQYLEPCNADIKEYVCE